jgi:hypothetical protein
VDNNCQFLDNCALVGHSVCPDLFCDNYINPIGTMLASFTFANGALGTYFVDRSAIVPGNPFSIPEVFHIVSDGVNQAHLAGAIWVDPAGSVPVPGPVVGAGLPGPDRRMRWRSRLVATAAL